MIQSVIVKVQLPLAGDVTQALVYDRERKLQMFVPATETLHEALDGRPKAYFRAEYDPNTQQLTLEAEVKAQDW